MSIPDSLSPRLVGQNFEGHATPFDFQSQLEELRVLHDGWLDGKGLAPRPDGLDWLAKVFSEHYPANLSPPYLYPVADGGVRFEWSLGPQDVSLEIDLAKRSGEWHCLNLDTDEEEATTLTLDTAGDWNWLVQRLHGADGATR